mgnify:FL=1
MALLGRRRGNAAVLRDVQKFRDGLAQDEGRAPEQAETQAAPAARPTSGVRFTPPAPDPVAPAPQPAPKPRPQPAAPVDEDDDDDDDIQYRTVDNMEYDRVRNDAIAAMQAENDALRARLSSYEQSREDFDKFEKDKLIDKMIDEQGFDSISKDDARRLLNPILDGMRKQNAALGQALSAQYNNSVKQYQEMTKKRDAEQYNHFADKIRKKFPDLAKLQQTQAYVDVMRAPVAAGSDVTVGQLVAQEYKKKNYKYINNVLKQVRDRINSVPDISANAVVGGNAPSQGSGNTEARPLSDSEMSDLRFKLQNRQISRQEFSDALKRHREALRGNAE